MTLRQMIKSVLPENLRRDLRRVVKAVRYGWRRQMIRWPVMQNQNIKIILGAAETYRSGWYATNENWLDITNPNHWASIFKSKVLVTHMVAEHVFEHLTEEEARRALRLMYNHLVPGGQIRIAVPDGYHPDPVYLGHVGINGIGDDAADHKQLLNVDVLMHLMTEAGFTPEPVEYHQVDHRLITKPYDPQDGFVWRSRQNIANKNKPWAFIDAETSLIVDGFKK